MITKPASVRREGVVLIVVLGIMMVIVFLCLAVAYVLSQQSRIAEHKIRRTRAYYAAMAGVAYAFDKSRNGILPPGNSSFNIGGNIYGYPPGGYVSGGFSVDIKKANGAGPNSTDKIEISVDYPL